MVVHQKEKFHQKRLAKRFARRDPFKSQRRQERELHIMLDNKQNKRKCLEQKKKILQDRLKKLIKAKVPEGVEDEGRIYVNGTRNKKTKTF